MIEEIEKKMILNDDIDVVMTITMYRYYDHYAAIITELLRILLQSIASSRPGDNPEKTSESDDDGRLQNDQLWIRHFHVPRSK
jgi:hypothetical protein